MSSRRSLTLILFSFFSMTLLQVGIPLRLKALHVSPLWLGILLALPGLLGLFTDAPLAHLSDQIGRRRLITFGGVLLLGSSAVLVGAPDVIVMVIGILVYAVGSSAQGTAMLAAVTEGKPIAESANIQGWNGSIQRIGALGASFVVLATEQARFMFASMAVTGAISIGLSWGGGESRRVWHRSSVFGSYLRGWRMLRTNPLVEISAIADFLLMLIFVCTNSFLPLIFAKGHGLLPLGLLLVARDAAAVLTSPLYGSMSAKMGWDRALLLGMVSGTTGLCMCAFLDTTSPWFYVALALTGVALGWAIAGTNHAVAIGTDAAHRALGLVAAGYASRTGSFVFPAMCSLVFVHYGRSWMFYMSTFLTLLMLWRVLVLLRRGGGIPVEN